MFVDIKVDRFTPCLLNNKTGELVDTSYCLVKNAEVRGLKKSGWLFNWNAKELKTSEIYKLTLKGDKELQGLVAIENVPSNRAFHLRLAESAPKNKGKNKSFDGVGGHLFAIAVEKSKEAGYGGFIYFEAKNLELVEHYQKYFGAQLIGMPHEYSMIIEEDAAERLLEAYTLEGEVKNDS